MHYIRSGPRCVMEMRKNGNFQNFLHRDESFVKMTFPFQCWNAEELLVLVLHYFLSVYTITWYFVLCIPLIQHKQVHVGSMFDVHNICMCILFFWSCKVKTLTSRTIYMKKLKRLLVLNTTNIDFSRKALIEITHLYIQVGYKYIYKRSSRISQYINISLQI